MLAIFPLIQASLLENDSQESIFHKYAHQVQSLAWGRVMMGLEERKPLPGPYQDTEKKSELVGHFISLSPCMSPELIELPNWS